MRVPLTEIGGDGSVQGVAVWDGDVATIEGGTERLQQVWFVQLRADRTLIVLDPPEGEVEPDRGTAVRVSGIETQDDFEYLLAWLPRHGYAAQWSQATT